MALFYRRDLFAEAGLPDRVPETVEELMSWARLVTHPTDNTFGLSIPTDDTGWRTLGFLYSFGGRAVSQGADGVWRCVFDSKAAVEAYTFVARLFLEPFTNRHGSFAGTVGSGDQTMPGAKYAMWFAYLDQRAFESIDPDTVGFGPVPKGPTGLRGSEYNCMMNGLYAGNVDGEPARRDLAWDYVWFYGGEEANAIYARTFVENGLGRFVRPSLLRRAGYPDEADAVPPGWEEAYAAALEVGVPEPYGRNCQLVYTYMSRGIDQILNDGHIKRLLRDGGDLDAVRGRVRGILAYRVANANQKMLNNLPDGVRRFRRRIAAGVVAVIVLAFALVFRRVFRVFDAVRTKPEAAGRPPLRAGLAYLMMLPALGTIAVWSYWPLARGTLMAFQDYNVRGFTKWVGLENFAMVLFSPDFWHAIGISLKYTGLFMCFGFVAPIILALLLSEVPRGKILFRTLYYLPSVLSGVVVMYLWKGFYGPHGMINALINKAVAFSNGVFGTAFREVAENWLSNPDTALIACLLPTIWAGMGPGCLIYLAALKTVPDDIYEAAEIDGAGILGKVRHIALPSIRMLIAINFVGAIIGAMKSGSEFIMAMTGGGPYLPYGATEVVGLHIFWEAFGYLRFGPATAMAWVLGSMLLHRLPASAAEPDGIQDGGAISHDHQLRWHEELEDPPGGRSGLRRAGRRRGDDGLSVPAHARGLGEERGRRHAHHGSAGWGIPRARACCRPTRGGGASAWSGSTAATCAPTARTPARSSRTGPASCRPSRRSGATARATPRSRRASPSRRSRPGGRGPTSSSGIPRPSSFWTSFRRSTAGRSRISTPRWERPGATGTRSCS